MGLEARQLGVEWSRPLGVERPDHLGVIAGYSRVISTKPPFHPRLYIARWVVAHHLGVREIPPLDTRYDRDPPVSHRIQSPRRSAAVPTWRCAAGEDRSGFCWRAVTFPEAEINSMPRRAAAAFCLPARCEVRGVPPWATASRKCLAVFKWGLGA